MLTRRLTTGGAVALFMLGAGISSAQAGGDGWCVSGPNGAICKVSASSPGGAGAPGPSSGGSSAGGGGAAPAGQASNNDDQAPEYTGPGSSSPFIIDGYGQQLPALCGPGLQGAPGGAPAYCGSSVVAPPAAPGAPAPAAPAAPAAPPPPSPAQLAQQAYQQLSLTKPVIGTAPCSTEGCMGAVGVPVWLWTQPWVAQSATASAGGISVTVTAKISKVTWSMGDGSKVACGTPGTAFDVSMGFKDSPDCGYRYQKTSARQPGQKYTVTASALWNVVWTGAYTATTTVTTSSTTQLAIGEYQVIVTG